MKKGTKNLILGVLIGLLLLPMTLVGGVALKNLKKDKSPCEHIWGEGKVTLEATCSREGEMTFACKECHKVKTEPIARTEHHFEDVVALEPTCTQAGHTEYSVCVDCGAYENDVAPIVLPARGHYYLDGFCVRCGEEYPLYSITYKAVIEGEVCDIPEFLFEENGQYPNEYSIYATTEIDDLLGKMNQVSWDGWEGAYCGSPYYVNGGDGYMFYGWYLDEDCTQAFTGITETQRGDLTLYAKIELDKESDWTRCY